MTPKRQRKWRPLADRFGPRRRDDDPAYPEVLSNRGIRGVIGVVRSEAPLRSFSTHDGGTGPPRAARVVYPYVTAINIEITTYFR